MTLKSNFGNHKKTRSDSKTDSNVRFLKFGMQGLTLIILSIKKNPVTNILLIDPKSSSLKLSNRGEFEHNF